VLFGTIGSLGSWNQDARLIAVSQGFIVDADTRPIHVAATIVHEATHAWLDSRGFSYAPHQRARVEAICYRAEAAFIRRVPGESDLASMYESCARAAVDTPDDWSDDAARDRAYVNLKELGFPAWLARRVSGSSSRHGSS
jgi:hypothetical protein